MILRLAMDSTIFWSLLSFFFSWSACCSFIFSVNKKLTTRIVTKTKKPENDNWKKWSSTLNLLIFLANNIFYDNAFLNGPIPASFLFSFFSQSNNKYCIILSYINWKSVDAVLGIRTHGRMMVGVGVSTVLRLPPLLTMFVTKYTLFIRSTL